MGKSQNFKLEQLESGRSGQANPGFVHEQNGYGTTDNTYDNGHGVNGKPLASNVVEGLEREQWDKPIEFLLSCIAMSVGLGNVWRFPFTAYKNGGGAFLIPYIIVLLLIGRPMYYLEMSLGQFASVGQVKVWRLSPFFKGIGYASAGGTICVVSYYTCLMGLTIYYFIASFNSRLPWSVCDDNWEDVTCFENGTGAYDSNLSLPELYYKKTVFPQLDDINDGIGVPQLKLSLCLLGAWIFIFLTLVKGVQSSGKVAYFTAIFPYVVLVTLLVRGVTLDGALQGIMFFVTPEWDKLLTPTVWFQAVGQCFFSLSTGFGPIIMFASYNPFRHNTNRDAMIISFMDTFTSLLAGFTIFSILGSLAKELGKEVKDVVNSGPGLAFISYPDAISKFDQTFLAQLFAVLFFLMLFTLGLGSATSLTGGIITIIHDQFPRIPKIWITTAVCIGGFFSGLLYVTPGGQFMLSLVDEFGGTMVIYVTATIEIIAISWFYGLSNICRDIEFMSNHRVGIYWKFCWGFAMPVGLSCILGYYLLTFEAPERLPPIAIICGWILAGIIVFLIPVCAVHTILTRKAPTMTGKIIESFQPTKDWGPAQPQLRKEWEQYPRNGSYWTSFSYRISNMMDRVRS